MNWVKNVLRVQSQNQFVNLIQKQCNRRLRKVQLPLQEMMVRCQAKELCMLRLHGTSIRYRCTTQFYCFPSHSDDSPPKSSTRSSVRKGNQSYFAFRTEKQRLWCCAKRWGQLTQGDFFRSSRNSTEVSRWDRCPFIVLWEIQSFFAC